MFRNGYSYFNNSILASISVCISVFTALTLNSLSLRSPVPVNCFSGSFTCLKQSRLVEFKTTKGRIRVRLFSTAPLTSGNFIDLVARGIYNNTIFNHIIRQLNPFVVEGGNREKKVADPINSLSNDWFINSIIEGPRSIPIEILLEGNDEPLYGKSMNNIDNKNHLKLLHNRGLLAMVRSEDPNSSSMQFYISLRPLPELDGRYSIFGQIEEGMEIVDKIVQGDQVIQAYLV